MRFGAMLGDLLRSLVRRPFTVDYPRARTQPRNARVACCTGTRRNAPAAPCA